MVNRKKIAFRTNALRTGDTILSIPIALLKSIPMLLYSNYENIFLCSVSHECVAFVLQEPEAC